MSTSLPLRIYQKKWWTVGGIMSFVDVLLACYMLVNPLHHNGAHLFVGYVLVNMVGFIGLGYGWLKLPKIMLMEIDEEGIRYRRHWLSDFRMLRWSDFDTVRFMPYQEFQYYGPELWFYDEAGDIVEKIGNRRLTADLKQLGEWISRYQDRLNSPR
jgi:hypothetical protein